MLSQTLFSSSFFDFQPADRPEIVSHWIWIYWLITAVLTLAVLGAWYYFIVNRVSKVQLGSPNVGPTGNDAGKSRLMLRMRKQHESEHFEEPKMGISGAEQAETA